MKHITSFTFVLMFTLSCNSGTPSGEKPSDNNFNPEIKYSVMMGETVINKYPIIWSIEQRNSPKWSYTYGLVSLAMIDLWKYTGEKKYMEYARAYIDALVDENGNIQRYRMSDYNLDAINSGKVLFTLYDITGEAKYKTAMDTLREQLKGQPRTQIGGFWHKKRYPHQMWLDGLYMGGPFYAQYAREFNEPESYDEIADWFINMEKVARDTSTGLLYHAWDESREQAWASKETGQSPNFWGRGMGWYAMALVDMMDFFPADHPQYDSIVQIINRTAGAIIEYQDTAKGAWYQVLDQGNREGNYLEGSVSTMFSYFLLKGIRKGYLDKNTYLNPAKKAFEGTVSNLVEVKSDSSLNITPVCAVAGLGGYPYRDGSYEYYIHEAQRDNDPKAVGPFIMAAIQYELLTK